MRTTGRRASTRIEDRRDEKPFTRAQRESDFADQVFNLPNNWSMRSDSPEAISTRRRANEAFLRGVVKKNTAFEKKISGREWGSTGSTWENRISELQDRFREHSPSPRPRPKPRVATPRPNPSRGYGSIPQGNRTKIKYNTGSTF